MCNKHYTNDTLQYTFVRSIFTRTISQNSYLKQSDHEKSIYVQVTSNAVFKETHQSQISIRPAEKRVLDVQVKSTSSLSECQATVWVYSLDLTTVLGPYTVSCSQPLQVEIDERDWGVYVSTEQNLLVSVWIE